MKADFTERLAAAAKRDLMHACVHEYAHYYVANEFGVHGFVNIERNDEGGLYESHWVGQFVMLSPPPNPLAAQMVGLAGCVAEFLLEHRFITPEQLFQEFTHDPDLLSDTDAKYVGEVTPKKVAHALWFVRRNWDAILTDAKRHAVTEERIEQ